jgi:hypothetical protein
MVKIDVPTGTGPTPELLWRQGLALADAWGMPRNTALMFAIMEHLARGDAEPFLATANEQRDNLPRSHLWALLDLIGRMLGRDPGLAYRLELVSNGKGRPPKAGTGIRDLLMCAMYEQLLRDGVYPNGRLGYTSEDAFDAVAKHFGIGIDTVRSAVKAHRKLEGRINS